MSKNSAIDLDIICGRIRGSMADLGMKQCNLAKDAKITPSALSQILRKERTPSTMVLVKLANALGVSVDYILGRADYVNLADIIHQERVQTLIKDYLSLSNKDRKRLLDMVSLIKNTE